MPTIRQMYGGLYTNYKTLYKNGELFRSTADSPSGKKADATSSLWSSYSPVSNSDLGSLNSLSSSARSLLSTYNNTKSTFYGEFDETISALKKSSAEIRNYDFNVGENAVTKTETTDEDGNTITNTKYSDKLTDALKAVEKFVSDYNDTIKFFGDNASVSKRVSSLATTFADTTYRAKNYESIGLVVNSDGTMKIDEDKLVETITSNPNKVSRILGKDGLSGKADSHISIANSRRDNLFPTAKNMLGSDLAMSSFYGGSGFLRATSYANLGSLINLMF